MRRRKLIIVFLFRRSSPLQGINPSSAAAAPPPPCCYHLIHYPANAANSEKLIIICISAVYVTFDIVACGHTLGLAGIDVRLVRVCQDRVVQRLKRRRTEYKKGCCM